MDVTSRSHLQLRAAWSTDDVTGVGRTLYEAVDPKWLPDWAASLLLYATTSGFDCTEIQRLVEISFDERAWPEARALFSDIRGLTLKNERRGASDSREQLVLDIAETTAKIIYNASRGPAPYDYHAGWRMAPRIKRLAEVVGDDEFEEKCWNLLTRTAPA